MESLNQFIDQYGIQIDDEAVRKAIDDILEANLAANSTKEVYKTCLSLIDLTSLNATDTEAKIEAMMNKVNAFGESFPELENVAAVCVYPALVPVTRKTLTVPVNIAAVSACFPSSQTFIEAKIAEVGLTVLAGADEIDVVQSIGKFLAGEYSEVYEELSELKAACRQAHLKVILESGSLRTFSEIRHASLIAIATGADFIKTSTGKTEPAATLEAAYVMCQTIKEYYDRTGIKIGFKPAGGIVTSEDAVKYYSIVKAVLGDEWLNNALFRFGASRMANNLLSSIYDKPIAYF